MFKVFRCAHSLIAEMSYICKILPGCRIETFWPTKMYTKYLLIPSKLNRIQLRCNDFIVDTFSHELPSRNKHEKLPSPPPSPRRYNAPASFYIQSPRTTTYEFGKTYRSGYSMEIYCSISSQDHVAIVSLNDDVEEMGTELDKTNIECHNLKRSCVESIVDSCHNFVYFLFTQ